MIIKGKSKIRVSLKGKIAESTVLIKKEYALYVMLVPFVLWYIIFMYRPMWGLQIAFKDYNLFQGISGSPWVGLENFKTFLLGPYFWRLLKNTFILGGCGIIFGFPAPILLALMLNEVKNRVFKKSVQTIVYLPYFISTVVVAGMVVNMLAPTSGIVNLLITKLGGESIYFLTRPEYFVTIFTSMTIWQKCGYDAVIFMAALSTVDVQLYEACVIDGGNKYHQIRNITIPSIMPTIIVMLIIKVGDILNIGYEAIILLYQPSTYQTADVILSYVYRIGLSGGNYGMATAVGLFNSIVALAFVWMSNKISSKVSEYSLW
jgi:ABC-type polysaccharide transport system, permease component